MLISKKVKIEGKKNPSNPRENLNKVKEVFISKKANYLDCMTANCCIGENVYKIYKYRGYAPDETVIDYDGDGQEGIIKPITHSVWQKNYPVKGNEHREGGEDEDINGGGQYIQPPPMVGSPVKIQQKAKRSQYKSEFGPPPQPNLVQKSNKNESNMNPYNSSVLKNNNSHKFIDPQNFDQSIDLGKLEGDFIKPPPGLVDYTLNASQLNQMQINPNDVSKQNNTQQNIPIPTDATIIYKPNKKIKGKRIMKIDEDSVLCPMVFCPASCRPFSAYAVSSNGIFEFAKMNRRFRFTLLCCGRPEILVYRTEYIYSDEEENLIEQFIGKVVNPCCFLNQQVDVYEANENNFKRKYQIFSSVFSLGSMCPPIFQSCRKVKFQIKEVQPTINSNRIGVFGMAKIDPKNQIQNINQIQGQSANSVKAGKIVKEYSRFVKECFSHGTHYKVRFPDDANVDQKMLILAGTMLLDMSFFDKKCCCPLVCY